MKYLEVPYLDLKAMNAPYVEPFIEEVRDLMDSSAFIGGKYVERFEKEFKKATGVGQAVGVSNGTDALAVILRALELNPDDGYIYYPANTFIGSILGGLQLGFKFKPYRIGSNLVADKHSFQDIKDDAIAIIVVHLYGIGVELTPTFVKMAKERDIPLIEDCSQAHFQEISNQNGDPKELRIKNKQVGTFGCASFYSCYPGKNLGAAGDAGIIGINGGWKGSTMTKLMGSASIRNYGSHSDNKYLYNKKGFNHRLDAMQAIFLYHKIQNRNNVIAARRQIAKLYIENLKLPFNINHNRDESKSVWHIYPHWSYNRKEFMNKMKERGISTNIHYPVNIHKFDVWKNQIEFTEEAVEHADGTAEGLVSLPCYETMSMQQIEHVIECANEYV